MSKKNNRKTRANALAFAIEREKEVQKKKEGRASRKKTAEEAEAVMAGLTATRISGPASPAKPAFAIGVAGKKFKRKGIRLRKNSMVRGIRIKDAASRQKVKEILAAEEAMKEMMVGDAEEGMAIEAAAGAVVKKKAAKGGVKKKRASKKTGEAKATMATD